MSREFEELAARFDGCGCEDLLDRLFALLGHEITESDAARLVEHSANCPTCASRTEEAAVIREVIRRGCCGEAAPESLRVKITKITMR